MNNIKKNKISLLETVFEKNRRLEWVEEMLYTLLFFSLVGKLVLKLK